VINGGDILLDSNIVDEAGRLRLPAANFDNVSIVEYEFDKYQSGEVKGDPIVIEAKRVDLEKPPPIVVGDVTGCCVKGRPPREARRIQQRIAKAPFSRSDTSVLSLLDDTGVNGDQGIFGGADIKDRVINRSSSEVTEDTLKTAFSERNGQTIVLVGHVEGENYVIHHPNKPADTLPIANLRALAQSYNVQLIDIGCGTATKLHTGGAGVGVIELIGRRFAANKVRFALNNSDTLEIF
jgi:hypothetical protein